MVDHKEYNYGWGILKVIMCFAVVCRHCWMNYNNEYLHTAFYNFTTWAVPVFMLLSFVLCSDFIVTTDITGLKNRVCRLYKPQCFWTIIIWGCYKLMDFLFGTHLVDGIDLLYALITGAAKKVASQMWFQMDLIILTIFMWVIFHLRNRLVGECILICSTVCSLILQYTGIHAVLWKDIVDEIRYTYASIVEMMPYIAVGYFICNLKIVERIRKSNLMFLMVLLLFVVIIGRKHFPVANGMFYPGIYLIIIATLLVLIFGAFPVEKCSDAIKKIISVVGKYTLGIYCLHKVIAFYLNIILNKLGLPYATFLVCILIYLLSYLFCFIISKIPLKIVHGIV